ncbi:MAG: hypothetical protein LUC38_02395 [Oscillospiraceae bacterium]|nr:hypothetical protein [Ruminococcus sp.]MCD8344796.1 hypothetical protein [Oscillospiraceae bacterium]
MRVILRLIALVVVLVVAVFGDAISYIFPQTYCDVIENNWGIVIPTDRAYSEEFSADSGASFHGDGTRYHVMYFDDAERISVLLGWSDDIPESVVDYSEQLLDELEIDNSYHRPNYESCVYYMQSKDDGSVIMIFWDENRQEMYVVEEFL